MESRAKSPPKAKSQTATSSEGEDGAAPKSKSKFGAFRTSLKEVGQRVGGKGKSPSDASSSAKAKDKEREKERKKAKKIEKLKLAKGSKAAKVEGSTEESSVTDGSETLSPAKASRSSKASTLVRKLSIGKFKEGKAAKTPTPEASPAESPAAAAKSDARQAPDGQDGSLPSTPSAPAEPLPRVQGSPAAPRASISSVEMDSDTPLSTPDPGTPLLEAARAQSPEQQAEAAAASPEVEPSAAEVPELRAPPLVASVVAAVLESGTRADSEPEQVAPAPQPEAQEEQQPEDASPAQQPDHAAEEPPAPHQPAEEHADDSAPEEEQSPDMSQRRSRKRQSAGVASALPGDASPGRSDPADGLLEANLPSLKAELATADKQRESDASEVFLDAERSEVSLPNGTQEEPAATDESSGDGQPPGVSSIGEAIAEARSKLTESLGAAAAAAAGQQGPKSPAQQLPEKREHLYKILVIGELGTGKTSIIKRYVHQFFSQHYRATIGVDFALKVLNWDANTIIRLQMWDIAGQERFGNMTRVYYKEAVGAFIVFDVTRVATFDAVLKWKQDLDSKVTLPDGSPIPCVLLANKCDQQKEGLVNNPTKMEEYCKEKGFSAWYETSAKENINIDEAARTLVKKILQNDQLIHQNDTAKDTEKINLEGKNDTKSASRCSC